MIASIEVFIENEIRKQVRYIINLF